MKHDLAAIPTVATRDAILQPFTAEMEERARQSFMDQIQKFSARELKPEDVHIRGMRVVNSRRDYYYSRFTLEALDEIAQLLPGRPLMVGHDRGGLPVARIFAADRTLRREPGIPKKDSHWVEALFYLPRDAEGDAIVRRIDQGLYREVSLGWRFVDARCGLCDNPIMSMDCPHIPGEVYEDGLCEFHMSGITHVMETSLVYAGGQKGTQTFTPSASASFGTLTIQPSAGNADFGFNNTASTGNELNPLFVQGTSASGPVTGAFTPVVIQQHAGYRTCLDLVTDRAAMLGNDEQRQRLRTSVQSIVCAKSRFDAREHATTWVRDHDFRADKVDENDDSYRFRQFDPAQCQEDSFRTIRLDDGVQAVVCRKKGQQDGRRSAPDSLESLFENAEPGGNDAPAENDLAALLGEG